LNTSPLVTQTTDAVDEIRRRWDCRPTVGIILGTGLGNFAEEIRPEAVLAYEDIPHFVRSTAVGHKGQLVCGRIADIPVVTMEGRFHFYEGYSLDEITLPVRVMKALGIELLIISNASGGLQSYYSPGDILVIEDHINLMGANPLVGVHDERLGPRFPDMSRPYDPALIRRALQIARRENFVAHRGVYAAVSGPNYETRAEYRFLRRIGADVIGMSTVPEAIVAAQVGLRVLALSVITNVCLPDAVAKTDGESVVAAARTAEHKMRKLVLELLAEEYSACQSQTTLGARTRSFVASGGMLNGERSAF
jgi:purine-nucleoside phosphorylase